MNSLTPFRPQPEGVDWPTVEWSAASPGADVDLIKLNSALSKLFDHGVSPPQGQGISLATLVVHRGVIVAERYGTQPDTAFGPGGPVDQDTTLISWSMAKSMTQAVLAIVIDELGIDVDAPVDIAEWSSDERRNITLRQLLQMRDGLDFVEVYVIDEAGNSVSDVINMLFGSGAEDVATYARSRPLKNEPGSVWSYSSGTTNIICGLLRQYIGGGDVAELLKQRIFDVLGMTSATGRSDAKGNFIGSSYVYATARDFAKFGYLYLRGGQWEGQQLIPKDWVEAARIQHASDHDSDHGYGLHWWIWKSLTGCMSAQGYEGQRIIVMPDRDLVVVHLGKWVAETAPALDRHLLALIQAFPAT
jgi:CubicO group peptidase (beta-lactamase class C family)